MFCTCFWSGFGSEIVIVVWLSNITRHLTSLIGSLLFLLCKTRPIPTGAVSTYHISCAHTEVLKNNSPFGFVFACVFVELPASRTYDYYGLAENFPSLLRHSRYRYHSIVWDGISNNVEVNRFHVLILQNGDVACANKWCERARLSGCAVSRLRKWQI